MNYGRTGEVVKWNRVHVRQPSVRPPCPMADNRIDKAGYTDAVEQVANKAAASDHRARSDSRTRIRKGVLEYPISENRNASGHICWRQAMEHEAGRPDPRRARLEHEGEAP